MGRTLELPIFPLSNVVLFPHVQCPLHLFEPRYRQMAEHAIASGGQIGMVVVPPEHTPEMAGDPPLYPTGCAGQIAQSRRTEDGRYHLVLVGTQRFRVLDERPRPAEQLFRVAEVELLDDPFAASEQDRVTKLRERIIRLVRGLVSQSEAERGPEITPELFRGVDDVTFVNSLCNALAFPPSEKQGLLEADSIPARFDRLEGLLSFRFAEQAVPGPPHSGTLH